MHHLLCSPATIKAARHNPFNEHHCRDLAALSRPSFSSPDVLPACCSVFQSSPQHACSSPFQATQGKRKKISTFFPATPSSSVDTLPACCSLSRVSTITSTCKCMFFACLGSLRIGPCSLPADHRYRVHVPGGQGGGNAQVPLRRHLQGVRGHDQEKPRSIQEAASEGKKSCLAHVYLLSDLTLQTLPSPPLGLGPLTFGITLLHEESPVTRPYRFGSHSLPLTPLLPSASHSLLLCPHLLYLPPCRRDMVSKLGHSSNVYEKDPYGYMNIYEVCP